MCLMTGESVIGLDIYRVLIEDLAWLAITQAELKMAQNWFRRIRWVGAVVVEASVGTGGGSSIVESR